MPKDVPEPFVDAPSPKKARSLNAFSLETPGPQKTVLRGRHHIPNYSHISHQTNDDRLLEGTAESTDLVYTVAQKRIDESDEEDQKVIVINNGTGVQVIVLSENSDNQKLIEQLLQNKKAISANQVRGKQTANLEQHLSNGQVLKDVLDDLTEEGQIKKLNLLKESLHHKTEVFKTNQLDQENKKLTNVGISLHKQGQVLEHFVRKETPIQPDSQEKHVSPRTQQLLNKKRRLQSILAELKLLAQAKKNLEALQPSLKLQEKILN